MEERQDKKGLRAQEQNSQTQRDVEQHRQGSIRLSPSSPHQQALT